MTVRTAQAKDAQAWSEMRTLLWPDTDDDHHSEIYEYFNDRSRDIQQVYVVETENGVVGFIELNIRNYAEGSLNPEVPYIEGWFVDPQHRGQGFGAELIKQAESWAKSLGFQELASDAEILNTQSIDVHRHLGFDETDRIVCFLKKLNDTT